MSTDDIVRDARKTARDAKDAASDKFSEAQDDLLAFTQQKPLMALLSAFVVGIVVGKVVL